MALGRYACMYACMATGDADISSRGLSVQPGSNKNRPHAVVRTGEAELTKQGELGSAVPEAAASRGNETKTCMQELRSQVIGVD